MADINTIFTRKLLSLMHADVRKAFPQIKNVMAVASVTHSMRDQYFVEINVPRIPYFYSDVNASDSYDARYKAWSKFLAKHGPPEFHSDVSERFAERCGATP